MATFDYNTGKELLPGQEQSTFNTQTGQKIGTDTYSADSISQGVAPKGAITAITSASIQETSPYTLPESSTSTTGTGVAGFMEAYLTSQKEMIAEQKKERAAALKRQEESASSLQSSMNELLGISAEQASMEEAAGIDKKAQAVTNYTNQLEAEQLSMRRQIEEIQKRPGGTLSGTDQAIRAVQRESLSKQADLALLQSAANRDLATAQSIIDRKIQLKLEPLKLKLEFDKFFYSENKDLLTKAEDRMFKLMENRDAQALQFMESEQKTIHNAWLTAAKNGAPEAVLQGILSSRTSGEALSAIGQYGIDPLDREYKQASIANIYSQMADRESGATGIDPQNLIAYAQQYASTGQIPTGLPKGTFGVISEFAKGIPKPEGTIVDVNTGVRSGKVSAGAQDGYSDLYSAIQLAGQLKELDTQRMKGVVAGTLGKIFGGKNQSEYMATREQIVDLLSRARTGATINSSELKLYGGMLPGRFAEPLFVLGQKSQNKIDNFINTLSADLDAKTRAQGLSIYGFSTVNSGGQKFKVGDVVQNAQGQTGRVLSDGSIFLLQ